MLTTRSNYYKGCEYIQLLGATNDGVWYGPQQVSQDDGSAGAGACARAANGSMAIEPSGDGELLLYQMYDLGSEPGTLVRARPTDAGD